MRTFPPSPLDRRDLGFPVEAMGVRNVWSSGPRNYGSRFIARTQARCKCHAAFVTFRSICVETWPRPFLSPRAFTRMQLRRMRSDCTLQFEAMHHGNVDHAGQALAGPADKIDRRGVSLRSAACLRCSHSTPGSDVAPSALERRQRRIAYAKLAPSGTHRHSPPASRFRPADATRMAVSTSRLPRARSS